MAEFTDERELEVIINTAKVGITPEQAGDITTNNQKLSYLLGFTQQQAEDIEANNEKVSAIHTLTAEQITDIQNNNDKISYTDAELVQTLAEQIESGTGQTVDVQAALDNAPAPSVSNPFTTLAQLNAMNTHSGMQNNPHRVTKAQVGLGSADDTADADKPVSTPQQDALDLKANASDVLTPVPADAVFTDSEYSHPATHAPSIIAQDATNRFATDADLSNLSQNTAHRTNVGNPHAVTVAQAGGETGVEIQARVDLHEGKQDNPHNVQKHQVGLDRAENTTDLEKVVSTQTQSALDLKADASRVLTQVPVGAEFTDTVYEHPATHPASMITEEIDHRFMTDLEKTNANLGYIHSMREGENPHLTTASMLGLGNVDDTSDLDKPISDATQAAIDAIEVPDLPNIEPEIIAVSTPIAVAMAIALG